MVPPQSSLSFFSGKVATKLMKILGIIKCSSVVLFSSFSFVCFFLLDENHKIFVKSLVHNFSLPDFVLVTQDIERHFLRLKKVEEIKNINSYTILECFEEKMNNLNDVYN